MTTTPPSGPIPGVPEGAQSPDDGTGSNSPPAPPAGGTPPPGYGTPPPGYPGQQGPYSYRMVPADPTGRHLSGWWRRGGALFIDGLIVGVPVYILLVAVLGVSFSQTNAVTNNGSLSTASFAVTGGVAALWLVSIMVSLFYFGLLFGSIKGQTVGMMAVGIAVRDARTGGPIGYGRGIGRQAMILVMGVFDIPLLIDYLWPLWDPRRQALHDKVVSSVVVKVR